MTTPQSPPGPRPDPRGPLAARVVALAETPDDSAGIDDQLVVIAQLAADLVRAADYASITTERDGAHTTVAASSDLARAVDDAQYAGREGPCLDALEGGVPVAVPDIRATMAWPGFRETARAMGLHASLSVPLFAGSGEAVAALNLYGRDFDAMAALIAGIAAVYDPSLAATQGDRVDGLDAGGKDLLAGFVEALAIRATIQRAIGIIMTRERSTNREAYLRLCARATEGRSALLATARALIDEDGGPASV